MPSHDPVSPKEEGSNHSKCGEKPQEGQVGFTTKHALLTFYEELLNEVQFAENALRSRKISDQLHCFNHKYVKSVLHWTSFLILFSLAIILLWAYEYRYQEDRDKPVYQSRWWLVEAILIILSLIFNGYLVCWNQTLVLREPIRLAQEALFKIRENLVDGIWDSQDYLHKNNPQSPCISTQWTYRDGVLVDLPIILMVKGDVILLRPGHTVPVQCQELKIDDSGEEGAILFEGDCYTPDQAAPVEQYGLPQGRVPLEPQKFTVLKTPFVENFRILLDKTRRHPASIIDSMRYRIYNVILERTVLPVLLFGVLIANVFRYIYIKGFMGHWTEMFLVLPVHTVLPLVPMVFPLFWKLINFYGQARLFVAYEVSKEIKPSVSEESFDSDSIISEDEARVNLPLKRVLHWLRVIATGNSPVATYNINLMHILGSVTTLCCVDKKGILSWPNPSAEKVFFFSDIQQSTENNSPHDSLYSYSEDFTGSQHQPDPGSTADCTCFHKENTTEPIHVPKTSCHVEVLDLTHDSKNSFGLHFDDPTWKNHISSLKPLGLNILANTCNTSIATWYSQFTDHVATAALENEGTVAVLNRRCLCELARQIGFSNNALDIFSKKQIIGVYRQVLEERAAKERLQRARSNVHHKIPMPNMVSIVVKEKNSGMFQLLCQGTADLILDCCTDFWNGKDLCTLTDSDRKKVLDFYHRTSIASYCTAFSYRPLTTQLTSPLKDLYIELPADSSFMCQIQNPSSRNECLKLDSGKLTKQHWCFSADSLVTDDGPSPQDNVPACFQMQCSQIFMGMVAMQYQARMEFVQMIDKLETAFIRFVHFSNENELRSRVFSEKMGLEAGWNCHISLASPLKSEEIFMPGTSQGELSHRTSKYSSRVSNDTIGRDSHGLNTKLKHYQQQQNLPFKQNLGSGMHSRSFSAPSVINLDMYLVKFDDSSSTIQTNCDTTFCTNPEFQKEMENVEKDSLLRDPLNDSGELLTSQTSASSDEYNSEDDHCSESHLTSSCVTDNTEFSLPGVLDNRAQLPRGIENIRPHLEKVDNVPLLVNLFTDCTPETTKEMIKIMQEYGEVVLCVGSSLNVKNTGIFLQADCGLAIEPLYPQLCRNEPQNVELKPVHTHLTPLHLASSLMSSPCPLLFRNYENISLIQLIAEARNHVLSMGNCFQFMLCCHLSLSLVQVMATLFLLPPPISGHQILWLIFIVVPLLSLGLMGNPVDPRNMTLATAKNCDHINKQMLLHFMLSFIFRFVPPVTVALISFALILYFICDRVEGICYPFDLNPEDKAIWSTWYEENSAGFTAAQNIVLIQLVLYFVASLEVFISGSFVHRSEHVWKEPPYTNSLWAIIVITILAFQVTFFLCDIAIYEGFSRAWLSYVHPAIWVILLIWPIVTLAFSELVKHYEIKLNVRYQKRAHLAFETKLGMNSPF
ncbi:transmembrane protein 94 isoform X2 [Octopus sinensis]|uniref:Transmembrane protein 94 isoform X2 n=1 Tax=Octopus sinensis TaxID=2607531 RepID=A0A6P7S4Z6_9MOLL|nr:transmembrane protein 94 isoform X2 [Octopus sinensis]